jgi:N-acetylglucosamine kinase-like BadF-type ATPase
MVRPLGEVVQTIGGYGFHIYDDGGARWITIRYETEDAAKKARETWKRLLAQEAANPGSQRQHQPRN